MNLFVFHSHFGIGKIQQVNGNRVDVFFPQFPDEQLRQFTREAFGTSVRRVILNPGTPCIVAQQRCVVDHLISEGEASHPHEYFLLMEDGGTLQVSEIQIELPIIEESSNNGENDIHTSIRPGLIVSANDHHGFGKVLDIDDYECNVAFFHHPGTEDVRRYPLEQIQRAILSPETRVFIEQNGSWLVGRVIDCMNGPKRIYTIRFPNKIERTLFENDIYVRCLSARHSPVDLMANRGMETQFFYDSRISFINNITKQRKSIQGLSAVLSSNVELVAHQIRAAQQVLTDPIQRYILADEVGLGKTVEAGFVIRQTMLDLPLCRIGVLTPPHLVEQWKLELQHKFRTSHFPHPPVVLSYEQAGQLAVLDLELLVVDEAHNIFSPRGEDTFITTLCLNARRLLLLTATPVIGNEQTFLNMLKVLDPEIFNEMSINEFRGKVERRQEFGTLARMLGVDMALAPPLPMIAIIAHELLSSDDEGMVLLEALKHADGDGAQREARSTLYHHIVEHHRIFHRLIRNRRKDITDNTFLPRSFDESTDHVLTLFDDSPATLELCGLFVEWRQMAFEFLHGVAGGESAQMNMAMDCARLFEAVGAGTFGQELDLMVKSNSLSGQVDGVESLVSAALKLQAEIVKPTEILGRAVEMALEALHGNGHRQAGLIDIIVFASNAALCRELEENFLSPNGVRIEFFSRIGEEGQNLQHGQIIIHMDIPLDPVRLEQRIGRVDRFNRKARSLLHVCRCPGQMAANNPWLSWVHTLVSGYRIFNEPISDVQFLLENESIALANALLEHGVAGIDRYRESLPSRLAKERNSLDEQYEFDQRSPSSDNEDDWLETLLDVDENEEELASSLEGFILRSLEISLQKKDDRRSFKWTRRTLIPENPWKEIFNPGLELPSTFRRIKAVRDPEISLLRLGHPLIDGVERFSRWDIRGLAFATWRTSTDLSLEEPWVGFKLDFVVEGDLRDWENDTRFTEQLTIARRRTDSLLPPWMETHFLDFHLVPVKDKLILKMLCHPYKTGPVRDYNLQSRPQALESVIDAVTLERLSREATKVGDTLVREGHDFQIAMNIVRPRAQTELNHRLRRIKQQTGTSAGKPRLTDKGRYEEEFELRVAKAVLDPLVRLESIGLFILAPEGPEKFRE